MRTGLIPLQTNILDQDVYKELSWLFEIDLGDTGSIDYYLSTKKKVYGGNTYSDIDGGDSFLINFSPIKMRRNYSDRGIMSPSSMSLVLSNKNYPLIPSTFEGAAVTIRLVIKADLVIKNSSDVTLSSDVDLEATNVVETEIASWGFVVRSSYSIYQKLYLYCVDWLSDYIDGDYPNTPLISTLWTAANIPDDNVCVPKIFGECYFPIRWTKADVTADDLYVLGEYTTGETHTIIEWHDPIGIGIQTYTEATYIATITENKEANDGNYYGTAIFLLEPGGTNIFWERNKHPDMPCKYSNSATVDITNPIEIIKEVLLDMGVPVGKINNPAYLAAKETWRGRGLRFSAPFWYKRPRAEVLASLLTQCNTTLIVRDQLFFKVNTTAVQHTINNSWIRKMGEVGEGTFTYRSMNISDKKDSGHILYRPTGKSIGDHIKALIAAKITTNHISETTLDLLFIKDSIHAQKIGKMALQRMLLPKASISALLKDKSLQVEVGDMVNIEGANYGAVSVDYPVMIDEMTINRDGSVQMSATIFSATLDEWDDIAYNALVPIEDTTSDGFYSVYGGPVTEVSGELIETGGSIKLAIGKDIILEGDNSDSAKIILAGSDSGIELSVYSLGTDIFWLPQTDNNVNVSFGSQAKRIDTFVFIASILISINCRTDTNNNSKIEIFPKKIDFEIEDTGTSYEIQLVAEAFQPKVSYHKLIDLGVAANAWRNIWGEQLHLLERSSDPSEPAEGQCVVWMSDGTGKGDDGDILIASKAGGTTKWGTLFDHSVGNAW